MYLVAYDVENHKRRKKAQKIAYSYAFGGQKSAVEAPLNEREVFEVARKLSQVIDLERDKVHIVKVKKFIFLRSAKEIKFEKGDIVI